MKESLASYIDHTLLKQDSTREAILNLCAEARQYQFAAVCVNPYWVALAAEQLSNSKVKVATVVGFPLGASTTSMKRAECREAIKNGASEIDMVLNIGALKSGDDEAVYQDIVQVVQAASDRALVKVILETCLLNEAEKRRACQLAKEAGAHFVKTSTGFAAAGAQVEDIRLMHELVGDELGIKASGGIRDYQTARAMIEAGANRIGASASVQIIKGLA